MIIKCPICSKDFYAKPSHVAKGRKYCTKDCFDKWQRDNKKLGNKSQRWKSIKRVCKTCGKEFYRCPAKIALGRGIYCSKDCYRKGMIGLNKGRKLKEETRLKLREQRLGKLNPAYIDGRSFNKRQYQEYGDEWNVMLREKVFNRLGKKCIKCNTTNKILHIHHLDKNRRNHQLENLVPICVSCHAKIHTRKLTTSWV